MGRNIKGGLSYFPLDVDFFEDDKVAFVSARFGVKGDGILTRLLCKIYRQGYAIKFDDDVALLFARSVGDINLHGLVKDVVNECLKRGFFDETIFKRLSLLTSKGIQKRYAKICIDAKRKEWEIPENIDLLLSECLFTPEEIPKTPEEIQQSKVKYSKEKNEREPALPISPPLRKTLLEKQEETRKRQKDFYQTLIPYLERYGKQMVREFYDYWAEQNKSFTKFKMEMQDTWDLEKRLERWENKPFNKKNEVKAEPKKRHEYN